MAIFNTVPPLKAGSGIQFDGEVIRTGAAPRNLLDNSNFLLPVNQREQNVYTGVCYTIDRWRTWDEAAEIKLVGSGVSVSGGVLSQYLDKGAVSDSRSYTIACEDAGGTLHVKSGVLSDGIWGDIMSFSVDGNGTPLVQLNAGHTYVWAAVYDGDYTRNTLPKYESKGMSEELRACQYYFERVYVHAISVSVAVIYKQLRFATKRITPTIVWHKSTSGNLANENLGNWNISKNDSNGEFGSIVNTNMQAYWYGYADVDAEL